MLSNKQIIEQAKDTETKTTKKYLAMNTVMTPNDWDELYTSIMLVALKIKHGNKN